MILKRLSLINFKNIAELQLDFSPSINALVGGNGAGKTNIIDAIHYLAMSKSMFSMTDRQSIRHSEPFFVIDGSFSSDAGASESVACSFSRQQAKGVKSLKRNGKEYDRLSDHVGFIPVVVVSPQDSALVYDSAEERRRFLNSFISQLDPLYLNALIRYNATLTQRNTALKAHLDGSILDIYDEQLAQQAELIHAKRHEVVSAMQPLVESFYATLSGDRESVSLEYSSALNDTPYRDLLRDARGRDLLNEFTTVGIHRDDLTLKIGGHPLRKYGSQGQQKSFLISLKLAQYQIVSQSKGRRAILLLDDLFDKLDSSRVSQLIKIVSAPEFGQIFITDCNRTRLERILSSSPTPYSLFEVKEGSVQSRINLNDN